MVHAFDSRTCKAEANRTLRIRGQPRLHSNFQASENYIMRLCLKKDDSYESLEQNNITCLF